ncbi:MAG: hypothetical protein H6993_01350 [Pseudomonadales bacterium]|nr:hypothetical protein [Pseudomonadales bacterium]MCP5182571.1 hypothetical protein [Pseudomonadales bacterium]
MSHLLDGAIVLAVMAGTTWLGHWLGGNIRDRSGFFSAGGTLPWWAVSASIIATLVSSVTFVSVPAAVFRDGGNLTYAQVVLGLALGKLFIAALLARPYYESRGVRTAYEYIGARMDMRTGEFSMWLGLVLNVINSGIKLLTASLVLDVITAWGLPACGVFIVLLSLLWSALAGVRTVIWTDFVLFVFMGLGALFALLFVSLRLDTPPMDAWRWLDAQGKLVLFDFSTDPTRRYSIWAGVLGSIGLSLATGATQATWQRVRACRSAADARRAYNWSAVFYVMHLVILGVGLALAVYYMAHPLDAETLADVAREPDRIFPIFIVHDLPPGVSGLFIAAIFAAAISTQDSALAEAADVTVHHVYERLVPHATERAYLLASRLSLAFWSLVFLATALFFSRFTAEGLLDLTFKLPNYVYGPIFGTIVLARFGLGRFPSFLAGFVVACSVVAWLSSQSVAYFFWCPLSGLLMVAVVWGLDRRRPEMSGVVAATRSD